MKKASLLGILFLISVGVPALRSQEYTIRENDTLADIAERQYGSESFALVITYVNPDLDPAKLRPGQVIKLPALIQVQEESDWTKAVQRAREVLERLEQARDAESARETLNELEKSIMAARLLTWRKPEQVSAAPRAGTFFQILSAPFRAM